ncbi:uncharacterized protein LOC143559190 [Bidens hawaiensis]|uniref:uncharacterized protein LOC143559190 n=1 Tax=Bidens hawaiensis TaxID=980011 RepID=UPI004048F293
MRQRRWLELLKDYDANIQYHPGKANVVADALSRKNFGVISSLQIEPLIILDLDRMSIGIQVGKSDNYLARMQIEPDLISRIKEAQKYDGELCAIVQNIEDIPMWKCDEISMDFVMGFPKTFKKNDAIWVVVDRLSKSAHFLPIQQGYPVRKLYEVLLQEIIRLHGTPSSIVSDRDPRFTSRFWKGFQAAWGHKIEV